MMQEQKSRGAGEQLLLLTDGVLCEPEPSLLSSSLPSTLSSSLVSLRA